MFKNYLKTAVRSFKRNKVYSLLNVFGLAIGIACAALIFLWVEDEVNFDRYFSNYSSIYRVMENQTYDGVTNTFGNTPGPLAAAMKAEIPGIKTASRSVGEEMLFSLGDKKTNERGNYADPGLIGILNLHFVYGKPQSALNQIHSIILTQKMSKKFFGDANPLGKNILVDNKQNFTVTGVVEDLPENVSINFEWLMPFAVFEERNPMLKTNWGANWPQTFVQLEPAANLNQINKQLNGFIKARLPEASSRPFLFAMNQWHLYRDFKDGKQTGSGKIEYVHLFSIIAWIIILIACINFMNLATARSEQRAKEVGVRKVLGAEKALLISQFITEAVFMALFSVLIAALLVFLLLPAFNHLVEKQLALNLFNPVHLFSLLGIGLISGLLAGSYPALYLSSFNPVTVFKGLKIKGSTSANFIRQSLVVLQFTVSIILIVSTIIIYQQIQHVKNRQLGYSKNQLLYLNLQGNIQSHFEAVQHDLIATGAVEQAALSSSKILSLGSNTSNFDWAGKEPSREILITVESVSKDYLQTLGMKLLSGRNFQNNKDSTHIIINETMANLLGKGDAVGKMIKHGDGNFKVAGVVKNFVFSDLYEQKPEPVVIFNAINETNYLSVKLKANQPISQALNSVEAVIKKYNPDYPVDYSFLDEDFNKSFKSEMLIGTLSRLFAVLTILISCLGLFGLTAYTAEQRTKEIGIRKILGATVTSITTLLAKDFLKLIVVALLVAVPLSWLFMQKWLQNYAYKINISWWVFVMAGAGAIVIALVTISFQAVKAALANPVESLKVE